MLVIDRIFSFYLYGTPSISKLREIQSRLVMVERKTWGKNQKERQKDEKEKKKKEKEEKKERKKKG